MRIWSGLEDTNQVSSEKCTEVIKGLSVKEGGLNKY